MLINTIVFFLQLLLVWIVCGIFAANLIAPVASIKMKWNYPFSAYKMILFMGCFGLILAIIPLIVHYIALILNTVCGFVSRIGNKIEDSVNDGLTKRLEKIYAKIVKFYKL